VPAIHTEFAVLHVQKATAGGTVRIEGQSYADIQQALCADTVIVTAEDIVDEDDLRRTPELNPIPFFVVKHVCHVPYGAHPYAVYNYYDYDPVQLKEYHESARDDAAYRAYLDKYVYGIRDHQAYLEAVGGPGRMRELKASPGYGYSPDLKRR
jgi:glutaconate CoA-transferase subunit A